MWNKIWPVSEGTGTSAVSGSTDQIRANWTAMELIMDVEHDGMASAASGEHPPGQCGFTAYNTKTAIETLSSPPTGALAYASDTGEFLVYIPNEGWEGITETYWSRSKAIDASEQSLSPETTTKITFTSEDFDSLSEFADSRFTAKSAGFYLIIGVIRWPATTNDYQKCTYIYKNGALVSAGRLYGSGTKTVLVHDVVFLAADDYIELCGIHKHTSTVTITGAGLTVFRLS